MSVNLIKSSNSQSVDPKKDRDFKVKWSKAEQWKTDNSLDKKNIQKSVVFEDKLKDKTYLENSRKAVINEIKREKNQNQINKKDFWGFFKSTNNKSVNIKQSVDQFKKEAVKKDNQNNKAVEIKKEEDEISFFELLFGKKIKHDEKKYSDNLIKTSEAPLKKEEINKEKIQPILKKEIKTPEPFKENILTNPPVFEKEKSLPNISLPKKEIIPPQYKEVENKNKLNYKIDKKIDRGQGIIKTNLIEKQEKEHSHKSRFILLFVFVFSALIILITAYFGVVYLENKNKIIIGKINNENKLLNLDITKLTEEVSKGSLYRKKLGLASYLLDNHVYWTQFFNFLEENTLPDVYYTNGFNGVLSDSYNFSVIAKDFKTMETQVEVFKNNENVVSASYSGGILSSGPESEAWYTFDLLLKLKPDIFYAK